LQLNAAFRHNSNYSLALFARGVMTKRRCLFAGISLILLGLLLVLVIPPWRQAVFAVFQRESGPPLAHRTGPNGWGGMNSSPLKGDNLHDKGPLVPGIDYCFYSSASYMESEGPGPPHPAFVVFVWGDFASGGAGGRKDVSKDGLKFGGHLWNQHGNRRVEFAGETKDGKTGRMTLDGNEYDLADGTLFLVSARRGYRVKQLKRDMARFQDAGELFQDFSKNDPEIRDFFPRAVATSPDGLWTAVGKDRIIRLMDAKTDKVIREYVGHEDEVTTLAFSPDSKLLASGGKDKIVLARAIPGDDPPKKFEVPNTVYNVEFSGEGKILTVRETVSPTETAIREFDLASGKQVRTGGAKESDP
jgi:hypothetical protein